MALLRIDCKIRQALSDQFATAARLYAEAVVSLLSQTLQDDYDQFWRRVEEAQLRSTESGRALNEHLAAHHCLGGNPAEEELSA